MLLRFICLHGIRANKTLAVSPSLLPLHHLQQPHLISALDMAQRQGFPIHRVRHAVKLSPRSKCVNTPISVGTVMNGGGYLYISIAIIKHSNLGSYENHV